MKTAFIYPGQGAQYTGMCREFYEGYASVRDRFDEASEATGLDISRLCFSEGSELDLTQYTQPAMVCAELAMTEVVKEELSRLGIEPELSAGLSLGEYAAIAEAGAMSFSDAVRLVYERGKLMAGAVSAGRGAMAAVLNPDEEALSKIIAETEGAYIANYNSPAQIVITGYKEAVESAVAKLQEAGMKRCIMLNVSGPFHSPLLEEAGQKLGTVLEGVELSPLSHPYYANVDAGRVEDEQRIRELLVRQVSGSVCWRQTVEAMLSEGVTCFIEIGPGKTLSGFVSKTARAYAKDRGLDVSGLRIINIEKPEDLSKLQGLLEEA